MNSEQPRRGLVVDDEATVRDYLRSALRDGLGRADFEEMTMSGPGVYLEKPVHPDTYVAAVRRLLGIESQETPEAQPEDLRRELSRELSGADRHALQRALDALRKKER